MPDNMTVTDFIKELGPVTQSDLIPILQKVQKKYGYLHQDILLQISKQTSIPASTIYGVATFYEQFYLEPRGKHTVKCCRGTACHVNQGAEIIEAISQSLNVKPGETTEDMRFTFETVACLGTCALAPVIMIDEAYHGKMTPSKVESIIDKLKASREEC